MSFFKVEDLASEIASTVSTVSEVSKKLNSIFSKIMLEAKKNGHAAVDYSAVEEEKKSVTCAEYEDEEDFYSDIESEETFSEPKSEETFSEPKSEETFSEPKSEETFSEPKSEETFSEPKSEETFSELASKVTLRKSDLVRHCLKRHGGEIKNKDVINEIKRDHEVEVTASLVSILKKAYAVQPNAKGGLKKRKGEKKTSGSSLIRAYLENHGIDSENEEVVRHVSKTAGLEVRPTLVSSVRANMKKKGLKKIGRPKSKKSTVKVVIENLKKGPKDGMNLSQVASRAWKSGCVYSGKKGFKGFSQNIYQTLHNLCNKSVKSESRSKVPLVIHEKIEGERFGRYKINPKALRSQVA